MWGSVNEGGMRLPVFRMIVREGSRDKMRGGVVTVITVLKHRSDDINGIGCKLLHG